MTFLIDGYNLMHAIGSLRQGLPAGKLLGARTRFLDWLAGATAGRGALIRVVFDAQASPSASPESDHCGVRVRFAFRRTADDEIEELLTSEIHPGQITVVSNDARVREAGRRRGATAWTCEKFVDWTLKAMREQENCSPGSPESEKPDAVESAEEMAALLTAFSNRSHPRRKR